MKNIEVANLYRTAVEKVESWLNQTIEMLPNIAVAIIVVLLFYLLARLIKNISRNGLERISKNLSLNHLIGSVLYVGMLSVGLFIALDILELEKTVTSLLAGIGIIGLALSFAFQDTAANFISGVLLTVQTPIKSGDIVEIKDIMGVVKKINLRATEIETFQGTFVIIPNKMVFQNPIFNYSETGRRRVDLVGRVSYDEDLEK